MRSGKKYVGFVRMPNLRLPKNTRIDYRGFLVCRRDDWESILLTDEELKECEHSPVDAVIAKYADKPAVEHSEEYGDIVHSRSERSRSWVEYDAPIPEGAYINHDGEVVRDREDGREIVLVSKEDFAQYPGKSAMEIIAVKERELQGKDDG